MVSLPLMARLVEAAGKSVDAVVVSTANHVHAPASVTAMRSSEDIMWTVKFRSGQVKRFKFPIRTTPEGQAEPTGGWTTDPELEGPVLFTEPDSLGCDVWTK